MEAGGTQETVAPNRAEHAALDQLEKVTEGVLRTLSEIDRLSQEFKYPEPGADLSDQQLLDRTP
jgi:hypothetical protein